MNPYAKRTLAGVDVFIEAHLNVSPPKDVGPLKLKHVASRGLKLDPNSVGEVLDVNWICARYVFATPISDSGDVAIAELVKTLGKDFSWTSMMKLYDFDGKPAYT